MVRRTARPWDEGDDNKPDQGCDQEPDPEIHDRFNH